MGYIYEIPKTSIPDYCFLIAEIGINHNGSLDLAKDLIKNSKSAGFDAVKFQKRTIDIVYSEEILKSPRVSPWGETTRDQKKGLEFSIDDYKEINSYCQEIDIEWFVSCWDLESQKEMRIFETPYNKIASAMANNWEFVREVSSEGKVTFASTGMMSMDEIENLVDIFREYSCPLVLLHTVSAYPANDDDLNLNCIKNRSCI